MTRQLLSLAIALPSGLSLSAAIPLATMAGRLGFSAIHLAPDDAPLVDALERLSAAAAPALVVFDAPGAAAGLVRVNDPVEVGRVRAELNASDAMRPLLVAVPISIGRTLNEATARADLEERFTGDYHPSVHGIFGTFEKAQEDVLALARAGADGLVLDVPLERDVADVLAQIRALVIGATPELVDAAGDVDRPAPRTSFYGE
jgi:hypothetical protein